MWLDNSALFGFLGRAETRKPFNTMRLRDLGEKVLTFLLKLKVRLRLELTYREKIISEEIIEMWLTKTVIDDKRTDLRGKLQGIQQRLENDRKFLDFLHSKNKFNDEVV